ncbi:hypothetical protein SLH46_17350 [Draconibacterium sp. IB214405]|uniref:hypothetical protein n=1 Tax=Draconibacterium sp. IB214405 TaxID=3097352 RepID=UPI002A0AC434|nr:hypothetical protein [Draconibacterium sp. IB214405]MDX8340969.1 hypothetical protein [Draconibacterium sp. IB214405]
MSKTRKTLMLLFLGLSFLLVGLGSFAKFDCWQKTGCCGFVLAGLILAIIALVIAMRRPKTSEE